MAKPSRWRAFLQSLFMWVVAISAVAVAVIVIDDASRSSSVRVGKPVVNILPVVSFQTLSVSEPTVSLQIFSRLSPRYVSEIRSIVEGRVSALGKNAMDGASVQKNETLIAIESSAYKARYAEADHALAQALVEQLEENRSVEQARLEWELQEGGSSRAPTPLFLREPHMEAADLAVSAAFAKLEYAEDQLSAAVISAPFNATVESLLVSPGEFVNEGQIVAKLVSNDEFEIKAQLTPKQWNLLDQQKTAEPVVVQNLQHTEKWRANIRLLGRSLDVQTQLRSVYLSVENSRLDANVVGGQFVEVSLPGRTLSDVLVVPESAFTRDSAIWVLDPEDRLRKLTVSLIAVQDKHVILERPLHNHKKYRVVVHPQARSTVGTRVDPIELKPGTSSE